MIKLTLRRFLKLRRAALLIPIVIISLLIFNRLDLSRILKLTLFGPSLYELNQRSADVLFTHYNKNAWGLSEEEIDNLYSKWNAALASAEKSPEFTLSRGIVYSSFPGNVRLTIKSIKLLRHFGCALPIHVYHGSELGGEDISQFLQLVNVSVIDIKEKLRSMGITIPKIEGKQFHFKSAAIIYSDFKEVLFIDNDNIPIRDPTFLFSDPNYISTGTIFWKGKENLTPRPLENPPRQSDSQDTSYSSRL